MNDPHPHPVRRRLSRWTRCAGRYRRALVLRAAYGAATATGTTAITVVVFLIRRAL